MIQIAVNLSLYKKKVIDAKLEKHVSSAYVLRKTYHQVEI